MRRLIISIALLALPVSVLAATAPDPVGVYDQIVHANEDYVLNLTFKAAGVPENLTGSTFKLQCKKSAASPVFISFSTAIVNPAAGQTRHWLTRATTRANANSAGTCDLMQTKPDGKVTYRLKGTIKFMETVTR